MVRMCIDLTVIQLSQQVQFVKILKPSISYEV